MVQSKSNISKLEQYFSEKAWILKGANDASDFKVSIPPMLFLLRISDIRDEELKQAFDESDGDNEDAILPEFHRFAIPESCHWKDTKWQNSNVGFAIEQAFRRIEPSNKQLLDGIFCDAKWSKQKKLSNCLLTDLGKLFSQFSLSNSLDDIKILRRGYEYLTTHFADLTKRTADKSNAPQPAVNSFGLILYTHDGESNIDSAYKTVGMLLKCVDQMKHKNEDKRPLISYGRENILTSISHVRFKMFFRVINDFLIVSVDTLWKSTFFGADRLKVFDCVIIILPLFF